MTTLTDRVSTLWSEHRALVIAAVVALALVITTTTLWLTNYAAGQAWEARAGATQWQLDNAETRSNDRFDRVRDLTSQVSALDRRVEAYEQREAEVREREEGLAAQEAAIAAREAAVATTEQQVAAATISTGVWTVGIDIEPGTYRTSEAVTGSCYWAIYRSGTNQDDIVQNDIVDGGFPTVTLSEGQDFETSRCGSWARQ